MGSLDLCYLLYLTTNLMTKTKLFTKLKDARVSRKHRLKGFNSVAIKYPRPDNKKMINYLLKEIDLKGMDYLTIPLSVLTKLVTEYFRNHVELL